MRGKRTEEQGVARRSGYDDRLGSRKPWNQTAAPYRPDASRRRKLVASDKKRNKLIEPKTDVDLLLHAIFVWWQQCSAKFHIAIS